MDAMNWLMQTSAQGTLPMEVSEFLLNDLGIFMKKERRMPKKAPLTALTGFRVGYAAVPGTDYRMAPMERNAILWHKITTVSVDGAGLITVCGNQRDVILLSCAPENRDAVLQRIALMRQLHPAMAEADFAAASWICWRDDDDWGDVSATLVDMIQEEADTERFIEPEVLEETVIDIAQVTAPMRAHDAVFGTAPGVESGFSPNVAPVPSMTSPTRPKFCSSCGERLPADGSFCENCGTRIG